jgi:hypothetical protein
MPVATPRRETPQSDLCFSGPAFVIEPQGDDVTRVGVVVGPPPFVEASRGQLAHLTFRIGPVLEFLLVEVSAKNEIGVRSNQSAT